MLISGLVLFGGATFASSQAADHQVAAAVIVAVSAVLAASLPVVLAGWEELGHDLIGTAAVGAYATGAIAIAAWLQRAHPAPHDAVAAVAVAESAFDVMVFALFRERFARLFREEAQRLAGWRAMVKDTYLKHYRRSEPESGQTRTSRYGATTVNALFGFGLAVLAGLVATLVAGARPLGLNDSVHGNQPAGPLIWELYGAAVVAGGMTFLAWRLAKATPERASAQGPDEPPPVNVRLPLFLLAFAALVVVGGAPYVFGSGSEHTRLLGNAAAAFYAVLTIEALAMTVVRLQLQRLTASSKALILGCGLAVFLASRWLLLTGIWSHGGPAAIARTALVVGAVLLGCAAVSILIGRLLDQGATGEVFTPESPSNNLLIDHGQYAVLALLAGVVPVASLAHIHARHDSVVVVASLLFVPGLIGAFLWVIDQNRHHHEIEQKLAQPIHQMWKRVDRDERAVDVDEPEAKRWLASYQGLMNRHRLEQDFLAKAFLFVGMTTLAVKVLVS